MSGTTVLIVDDSSVMRKIVERALRQAGLNLPGWWRRAADARGWKLSSASAWT